MICVRSKRGASDVFAVLLLLCFPVILCGQANTNPELPQLKVSPVLTTGVGTALGIVLGAGIGAVLGVRDSTYDAVSLHCIGDRGMFYGCERYDHEYTSRTNRTANPTSTAVGAVVGGLAGGLIGYLIGYEINKENPAEVHVGVLTIDFRSIHRGTVGASLPVAR